MSFLDWVEKIQNKPKETRKKIALAMTILFTGLLGVAWFSTVSLMDGFKDGGEIFGNIKDSTTGAGVFFGQIKDDVGQLGAYTEMLQNSLKDENFEIDSGATASSTEGENLEGDVDLSTDPEASSTNAIIFE